MSKATRTLSTTLLAFALLSLGVPSAVSANKGGRGPKKSAASGVKKGKEKAKGKTVKEPLGSAVAGSHVAPEGSALTGRRALGSRVAASQVANGTGNGNGSAHTDPGSQVKKPLGSRVAGSHVVNPSGGSRLGLGSTLAGSGVAPSGSKAALGSRLAGSHLAGSQVPSSRVGGSAVPAIVPEIEGGVPRVSTARPGLAFFLVDASGSMAGHIAGGNGVTKADAAAEAFNNTVMEMVLAHQGGDGRPKDRLNFHITEYGGDVRSPHELVSLTHLADNPADVIHAADGTQLPVWVAPRASGGTPMVAAMEHASGSVERFLQGGGSAVASGEGPRRLVLGFNLTDGAATDGDPRGAMEKLAQKTKAAGGELVMTNIFISENPNAQPTLFPTLEQVKALNDADAMHLYEMSSPVPKELMGAVREINPSAAAGGEPRMMAFNATLEGLNSIIQIGSSLAAQVGP